MTCSIFLVNSYDFCSTVLLGNLDLVLLRDLREPVGFVLKLLSNSLCHATTLHDLHMTACEALSGVL